MAQIIPLTGLERSNGGGYTHKVILTSDDIKALTSGTAYSIYPGYAGSSTKTNLLVKACDAYVKTAFVGTGTLVITVGDGTTANLLVTSTTIKTAGWIAGALTKPSTLAGDIIKFTPTAGTDITTFTAGEVHLLLEIVDGPTVTQ